MTIATEKKNPNSARHTLVRISGRRNIDPSIISLGGDLWQYTLPSTNASVPFELWYNADGEFTKVTGTPANDGEWSFDEDDRIVTFKLIGYTPGDALLLLGYYLFYCSEASGDTQYFEDPDDDETTVRNWVNRLASDPEFNSKIQDVTNGVFELANSSFEILNVDSDFEQYLTSEDSFYKRDVVAWLFINGEKQRSFTGRIVSVTLGDTISLNVLDSFTRLDEEALMGDSGSSVKIPTTGHPDDIGKPIPLIIADDTYSQRADETALFTQATDASEWVDGYQARCHSYSPNLGTTANRNWTLCRLPAQVKNQTLGAFVRAVNIDSFSVLFQVASYSDVRPGDTFRWIEAGVTHYGIVAAVGVFTFYDGFPYQIRVLGQITVTPSSVVASPCLSVWLEGTSVTAPNQFGNLPLTYGYDYSLTQTALSSGHYRIRVTMVNNFEGHYAGMSYLDPGKHRMKFAARVDNPEIRHGQVLKEICQRAGMSTNDATFDQADLDLVEDVCFSIPEIGDTQYSTYKDVVKKLLSSTLGYVRLNNDDEAEYYITDAPVAGDIKDSDLLSERDADVSIEYQDIVSAITPLNVHIPIVDTRTLTQVSSARAQILHGITNKIDFDHYMATQTPSRITEILAIRAERRVTYSYETATDDIDTLLGNDVTLESRKIVGGTGTANLKVTEVQKSADKCVVTATDLLGLT